MENGMATQVHRLAASLQIQSSTALPKKKQIKWNNISKAESDSSRYEA